jgi:integrase
MARKSGRLATCPHIPLMNEDSTRKGFFEADQLAGVLSHLSDYLRPAIEFASITGWRVASEVLPLEWRNVDLTAGEVRLDPGTTRAVRSPSRSSCALCWNGSRPSGRS